MGTGAWGLLDYSGDLNLGGLPSPDSSGNPFPGVGGFFFGGVFLRKRLQRIAGRCS